MTSAAQRDAFLDQLRAAGRDVASLTRFFQTQAAETPGSAVSGRVPAWAVRYAAIAGLAVIEGKGCPHVRQPTPIICRAWAPEDPCCPRCTAEHGGELEGSEEDRRCDRCGKIDDHVHIAPSTVGPVVILAGVCCSCLVQGGGTCTP